MISFALENLGMSSAVLALALFLAAQSDASSVPENTVYTLQAGKKIPLVIPGKAHWSLKNDKTERPGVGKTESEIRKKDGRIQMLGLLASLPGYWGRVGFSLMETAITKPIQRSEGLSFQMRGTEGVWASVLVKDRQAHQTEGILTFQWDFEVKNGVTQYEVAWKDFVPTIRGKEVSGFELDLFSVTALSFQVSRSKQKKWYETVPLEFELEL